MCTERFEPPYSLSMSKKKLGHITNINIWSYNLKFSEKTVLYFHFTALCYVQGARKKLKITSFIEQLKDLGYILQLSIFHTMLLNLAKKSVLILPFLLCLCCIVLFAGCAINESLNDLQNKKY